MKQRFPALAALLLALLVPALGCSGGANAVPAENVFPEIAVPEGMRYLTEAEIERFIDAAHGASGTADDLATAAYAAVGIARDETGGLSLGLGQATLYAYTDEAAAVLRRGDLLICSDGSGDVFMVCLEGDSYEGLDRAGKRVTGRLSESLGTLYSAVYVLRPVVWA